MAESENETIYDKDLKDFQIRRTWEKRFFYICQIIYMYYDCFTSDVYQFVRLINDRWFSTGQFTSDKFRWGGA